MNKAFLKYDVSAMGIQADTRTALTWLESGEKQKSVATINAHSTCVAEEDGEFRAALQKSDMLVPDGASIVWASRLLGEPLAERVSGYDFFTAFSALADVQGDVSYFFLGSSDKVLDAISKRITAEYPNIRIAGVLSPPFKTVFSEEDNARMIAAVNAAKPSVLWVGMTAPKQEKWVEENRARLDVGFTASIGAVFDFYAGTKVRAPQWMQRAGLEWVHRFMSEPKRVWKRYVVNNPRFVWLVIKNWLAGA